MFFKWTIGWGIKWDDCDLHSIDSVSQKLTRKHTDGDHVIAGCYDNHKHLPDAKYPNLDHVTVGMLWQS